MLQTKDNLCKRQILMQGNNNNYVFCNEELEFASHFFLLGVGMHMSYGLDAMHS